MHTSAAATGKEIAKNLAGRTPMREFKIKLCSSVYLGTTEMYLRLEGSRRGVRISVDQGSFDNPVHDTQKMKSGEPFYAVILAPFFDAIMPDFESRLHEFSDDEIVLLSHHFTKRWEQAIRNIPLSMRVVVLGLHSIYPGYPYGLSRLKETLELFNSTLRKITHTRTGAIFVDMESVVSQVGIQHAVDMRTYLRSRSPYTSEFTEELSKAIICTLGVDDRVIKAIALDCDNTLWGGVVGEDGFDGIQIDPNTTIGAKFHTAQRRFKELKELGILICLISKNNEEEVLKVLHDHEHQLIRTEDVISHRINWTRKSANLSSLANELNIGLSSFVFVDDSEYECAEVAAEAPEVAVFQMPKDANELPRFFAQLKQLCLGGKPEINVNKTEQYRIRQEIESKLNNSASQKEFFDSLDLHLKFSVNDERDVPRLAEMFAKTNQFNCTTIRRTPEEIKEIASQNDSEVVSVRVSDRFSDHGLTGLIVIKKGELRVQITDWMISCRVLGRGVEEGILAFLGCMARDLNQDAVEISYIQTAKNIQVKNLLETIAQNCAEDGSVFVFDSKHLTTLKPSWVTIEQ